MQERRPTVARIDLAALVANYRRAAERAGGRQVIAVVKADAYGHGAVPVARALVRAGCPWLAVVTVAEAAALQDAGIDAPLLVMGGAHDAEEADEAAARGLVPVVHHAGHLELLAAAAKRAGKAVRIHVEVDTGMGRMGVPAGEAAGLLLRAAETPGLEIAGLYTHLACADEPDLEPSRAQLRHFAAVLEAVHGAGLAPGLVHAANSAGVLAAEALGALLPEGGAVRPGIMLYGAAPAAHLAAGLRPVMTLSTRVARVRRLRPGDPVGYGSTWRAERATTVATLPVGYGDGVLRALGNRGVVAIAGRRMPMVGRVSMDFVTVDAGDAPVRVGDEAVLFGAGAGTVLPVEEAAAAAGTIPYEVLVRVGTRVPRVYGPEPEPAV